MTKNSRITDLIQKGETLNGKNSSRGGNSIPSLNLVYSENNGKRLKFSNSLYENLNNPQSVQFIPDIDDNCIIVGENLDDEGRSFTFSTSDSHIIYNSGLVKDIIETFNIEFGEGKVKGKQSVSKSFSDIEFDTYNDISIAIIKMK